MRLQPAHGCVIARLVRDRLLIDLGDDGSLSETDLVGERTRLHAGHDDTGVNSGPLSDLRGNGLDRNAEGRLTGIGFLRTRVVLVVVGARNVRVGLGAVADLNVSRLGLSVPEITDLYRGSDLAG